jgi:hypothetical protein
LGFARNGFGTSQSRFSDMPEPITCSGFLITDTAKRRHISWCAIFFGMFIVFVSVPTAWAGAESDTRTSSTTTEAPTPAVPLDLFQFESGYVFESDLNHGGSLGKQMRFRTSSSTATAFA